jgi:hypothetical protein
MASDALALQVYEPEEDSNGTGALAYDPTELDDMLRTLNSLATVK